MFQVRSTPVFNIIPFFGLIIFCYPLAGHAHTSFMSALILFCFCVLVLSLYGVFSRSTWVVLYAGKRNMHQCDKHSIETLQVLLNDYRSTIVM